MDYNYEQAIREDIRDYISEEYSEDELIEKLADADDFKEELNDLLFSSDRVTGNGSGSYTFSTYDAETNLCHNLDLLVEAADEFGSDLGELVRQGAEACDVTIRCYLLAGAISDVVDELIERYKDKIDEFINSQDSEN